MRHRETVERWPRAGMDHARYEPYVARRPCTLRRAARPTSGISSLSERGRGLRLVRADVGLVVADMPEDVEPRRVRRQGRPGGGGGSPGPPRPQDETHQPPAGPPLAPP